jgi:hypothetical protein
MPRVDIESYAIVWLSNPFIQKYLTFNCSSSKGYKARLANIQTQPKFVIKAIGVPPYFVPHPLLPLPAIVTTNISQ